MNKLIVLLVVTNIIGSGFCQNVKEDCDDNQCFTTPGKNLECNIATNKCQCKAGYMTLLDKKAIVTSIQDYNYCAKSSPAIPNTRTYGETCKSNTDCRVSKNLKCIAGLCSCETGKLWMEFDDYEKNHCTNSRPVNSAPYSTNCFKDQDCVQGLNLICRNFSYGNLCACKSGYVPINDIIQDFVSCKLPLPYSKEIDGSCNKSSECIPNAECTNGFCACKTGYPASTNKNFTNIVSYMASDCRLKKNGPINSGTYLDYCEANNYCNRAENFLCKYNVCVCKPGYRHSFVVTKVNNVLNSKPVCKLYQPAAPKSRSFKEYCDSSNDCGTNLVCQGLNSRFCFCHKDYQRLVYNKTTKKYDCLKNL